MTLNSLMEALTQEVFHYESDTFSSSSSKITMDEAKEVVAHLVEVWWNENIDGVRIDAVLSDLRENE